jgi:hypothetical protein
MHRWKVGRAPAEPAYRKRRRRALAAERKSRRRERGITAGLSRLERPARTAPPFAGHRTSADRDPAVVARIMGNDLGRGGIGFEGAGLIGGFFLRFMAEKFDCRAALARLADMLE